MKMYLVIDYLDMLYKQSTVPWGIFSSYEKADEWLERFVLHEKKLVEEKLGRQADLNIKRDTSVRADSTFGAKITNIVKTVDITMFQRLSILEMEVDYMLDVDMSLLDPNKVNLN